jgi:hypothetical protein
MSCGPNASRKLKGTKKIPVIKLERRIVKLNSDVDLET